MNFREISNRLSQILNEHAFDRKKAIFEITSLCIPYTTHILKLSIFANDLKHEYDVPKWKDEIYNYLNQASMYYDLKGNTTLKPKDYLDNFFFGLMETPQELENKFKRILKDLVRQGYTTPQQIDYHSIYQNHKEFVEEVLRNFPNIEYEYIMEVLDKYIIRKTH